MRIAARSAAKPRGCSAVAAGRGSVLPRGCSVVHLYTFAGIDGGDSSSGTFVLDTRTDALRMTGARTRASIDPRHICF